MQSIHTPNTISSEAEIRVTDDELHAQASQYISESNQLIFQRLPKVISQIIVNEVWKRRGNSYTNFGEYALNKAPDGLGITNNEMLWLLRSAMNIHSKHAAHWGDVLGEVDTHVRSYPHFPKKLYLCQ